MIREILRAQRKAPKVLVENKISFAAQDSELSIYDTFAPATDVDLASDQLLFCGMVSGQKVMHGEHGRFSCNFYPHESFVMAPNSPVSIDFPGASPRAPTTCLAIEICPDKVQRIAAELESRALLEQNYPEPEPRTLIHTSHSQQIQGLLERIVQIYTENHQDRSYMIELAVSELIVRLLRQQTREFLIGHSEAEPEHNGINAAVHYISKHLDQPLNVEQLAKIACMSRTKFFCHFRSALSCTPQEFLYQLRLKHAAQLLTQGNSVTAACYASGYNNCSHFSRSFRQHYGVSPSQYRTRHAT
ncbi:MAG: helix-turn-helix domain-containing protein [Pseudomonadales bacterium]